MARRKGIAGQIPFGAPVARDAACGIGGRLPLNAPGIGGMLPLNAAPGIGGCRSVGIGAPKTGVSNLAMATRRQARGTLGRVSAGGTAQGPVTGWARCMQRMKGSGHGCSFNGSMSFGDCSDACKRMAGWYSTGGGSGSAPTGVRRLSAGGTARGGNWADCWSLCQQTSNPALCVQVNCGGKTPPPPPIRTAGGARPAQPAVRGRRALTYKGGGIGKSYASRLLGKGVTFDVTRTGEGSYSATITTQGKSMANKVLGNKVLVNGGRHENGYHGSVGVGASKQPCYPAAQPCGDGRETCSYRVPGKHYDALGCRGSATWTYDQGGTPARPKASLSPASAPAPSRRSSRVKRGRHGRRLTMKAGR